MTVSGTSGVGAAAYAVAAQQATKDLTNALVAKPVQQAIELTQKMVGIQVEAATNAEAANIGSAIDLLA